MKGHHHTKAARRRIAEGNRAKWSDPDYRARATALARRGARTRWGTEAKLERARELLARDPGITTTRIAAEVGVSHKTAARLRREIDNERNGS